MNLFQKIFSPKPEINYYTAEEKINLGNQNIIISGITGTSKSTLCKKFIQEALEANRSVFVISNDSSYKDSFSSKKYLVNFYDFFEIWGREVALSMIDFYRSVLKDGLIVIDECSIDTVWDLKEIMNEYGCKCQIIAVTQAFPSKLDNMNQRYRKEVLNFYKAFLFSTQSISDSKAIANLPGCSGVFQPESMINRYNWLEVRYS